MLQEPIYLVRLRETLSRSTALSWSHPPYKKKQSKNTKDKPTDKIFTITYPELNIITKHPCINNKHQLVKRNMLNSTSKRLLSFGVVDLGHVIYLFSDDTLVKFWFVPQKYLSTIGIRKEINRLHQEIASFTPISTLSIYISKIQQAVEVVDKTEASRRALVGATL